MLAALLWCWLHVAVTLRVCWCDGLGGAWIWSCLWLWGLTFGFCVLGWVGIWGLFLGLLLMCSLDALTVCFWIVFGAWSSPLGGGRVLS